MFITSASGLICKTGFYFISFGHKNGVFFNETKVDLMGWQRAGHMRGIVGKNMCLRLI